AVVRAAVPGVRALTVLWKARAEVVRVGDAVAVAVVGIERSLARAELDHGDRVLGRLRRRGRRGRSERGARGRSEGEEGGERARFGHWVGCGDRELEAGT